VGHLYTSTTGNRNAWWGHLYTSTAGNRNAYWGLKSTVGDINAWWGLTSTAGNRNAWWGRLLQVQYKGSVHGGNTCGQVRQEISLCGWDLYTSTVGSINLWWEPRCLTALWASTSCYRDSFTPPFFFCLTVGNVSAW
jgi:hypothetical protein